MPQQHIARLAHQLNVPRIVAEHLFGKKHTRCHQCVIGAVVMVGGIYLGIYLKRCCTIEALHGAIEALAGFIHGIGLTPYVELFVEMIEEGD